MRAAILGATSDVGKELAKLYAAAGYDLVLSSRKVERLEPLKKDIELKYNKTIELISLEASDFDSHQEILNNLAQSIDIVVCIFGYLGEQKEAENNFEEASKIIDANYKGAVSVLNIFANVFEQRKSGIIVGVSSVAGERGRGSNYLYGSAKAGFTAYLSGLRNRLFKSGVHVLSVIPGFMYTKMTEGLDLPKPITATPTVAAKQIFKAVKKQKNIAYVLPIWWVIMTIIKNIPEFIFKRLNL